MPRARFRRRFLEQGRRSLPPGGGAALRRNPRFALRRYPPSPAHRPGRATRGARSGKMSGKMSGKKKRAYRFPSMPPAGNAYYFDRQSLMNFLRSSPFIFLSPASLLHDFIFSCCAFCLSLAPPPFSPFRHELMNFLRESPSIFLSPASLLQLAMRSCWAFCFSEGSFLAVEAAFFSSVLALSCAIASGAAASMKQHSPAISLLILGSLTI